MWEEASQLSRALLYRAFAARWLACALPCRRFAAALAGDAARLGADVDRYSFIVTDLHRLLLAGLPAHQGRNFLVRARAWRVASASLPCRKSSAIRRTAKPPGRRG